MMLSNIGRGIRPTKPDTGPFYLPYPCRGYQVGNQNNSIRYLKFTKLCLCDILFQISGEYTMPSYIYSPPRLRAGSMTWVPPKLQRMCSTTRLHPLLKTMSLDEFSMTTSLHGWHFIVNARNWKHKLAWGILIGCSTGALSYQLTIMSIIQATPRPQTHFQVVVRPP